MPPALVWALGVIGAAIVTKFAIREWHRVNTELEKARSAPVCDQDRNALPKLRRDPVTGVFRAD